VTITGSGFTAPPADTGVSFGGAAAQLTIDSGTQITATSPSGTGTVHITVTTPAGTSTATAADQFAYTATTAPPAITSGNATTYTVGTAGTFTVTTTGSPTPSISETSLMPSGVTFVNNGNGTATLSGIPGKGGTYPFTINAANGNLPGATQSLALTVSRVKLPF
jgi:IPT/TIG domain